MNDQPIDLTLPAIDIKLQLPLDDGTGRVIVFSTVVPQSCSEESINGLLDKFSRAGERQKALAVLPTYANQLEEKRAALQVETAKLFQLSTERDMQEDRWRREAQTDGRRNWRPSATQANEHKRLRAEIDQCEATTRLLEKQIASEESRVALYKERVNASDGAAARSPVMPGS